MSKETYRMRTSKPRQIKPWPDLTGLLPLLRADEGLTKSRTGKIHLDMSNVNKVDAIGLSIFIAQVCQIFSGKEHQLIVTEPKNRRIAEDLVTLKFQSLLSALGILSPEHKDLFSMAYEPSFATSITKKIKGSLNKIVYVAPTGSDRRAGEISRIKNEIKEFLKNDEAQNFSHQQVMIILVELVKNTLDHSGSPALLALKLGASIDGCSQFSFAYSDTGDGICNSVRKHMATLAEPRSEDSNNLDALTKLERAKRLAAKGSFADLLQWALQPGNSTKHGNGINLGLGLMLIVEASKNCNIRLTVKDADTSMVLTELLSSGKNGTAPYTHSLIRQLGVKTCASPMLIFHGEIDPETYHDA